MVDARNTPPHSLGLGGNGDEIDAIEEAERYFGLKLDYSDAGQWRTVGDVFLALQRALPPEQAMASETWSRFKAAISKETGVDKVEQIVYKSDDAQIARFLADGFLEPLHPTLEKGAAGRIA